MRNISNVFSLFLFITATSSAPASAASWNGCVGEFRAAGKKVPAALLRAGILQFHNLDLGLFVSEIEKIKVVRSDQITIAERNGDGRSTARWDRHSKRIIVNCMEFLYPDFKPQQSLLALHEYLGILGFKDEEYRMSTLMWVLAMPVAQKNFTPAEKKNILRRISAYAKADGGVVGVGGGGDIMSLYFRTEFLNGLIEGLPKARSKREREEVWAEIEAELQSNDTHALWPNGNPRK